MKLYRKPYALQMHEWNELDAHLAEVFPVQFFFRETLRRWISRRWSRVSNLKWKVIHRLHPSHRYHIIKPRTLEPGYHDPDRRIMHAMFHEVCEFAENNLMGDGIEGTKWTAEHEMDDEFFHGEQFTREKQIIELRNWWVIDRKNRKIVSDAMWGVLGEVRPEGVDETTSWIFNSKYNDTPEYKEYRRQSDHIHEIQEQWKQEDNRKMHELVDLLPHLWY